MANWFIESREGESWRTVSRLFKAWVSSKAISGNIGWSEGDSLLLPDGRRLFSFMIPDRHTELVNMFGEWAQLTGRLYGYIISGSVSVVFPDEPQLTVSLSEKVEKSPPP